MNYEARSDIIDVHNNDQTIKKQLHRSLLYCMQPLGHTPEETQITEQYLFVLPE